MPLDLLKKIFTSAAEGVVVCDLTGTIKFVNPRLTKLFDYKESELIGQKMEILIPDDLKGKHTDLREEYAKNPRSRPMGVGRDLKGRKKNGEVLPLEISLNPFQLDGDNVIAAFVNDISERKQMESRLKEYTHNLEKLVKERTQELEHLNLGLQTQVQERRMAEEALKRSQKELEYMLDKERELNELKSRFVSMASHEFRTPLSTVLSSIALIERYTDPSQTEKRDKHIGKIKKSVKDLTGILEDFLSLGKLEEGRMEAQLEEVEISAFIAATLEEMNELLKASQKFVFEQAKELTVLTDPKMLRQVLTNLISNAIKYSPENSDITISLKEKSKIVQVLITDEGIGIPAEDQKNMFGRFFRAGNVTNIQGTGLGLNIVKKMLDLLDGEIAFVSELEKGTTFIVSLPKTKKYNGQ